MARSEELKSAREAGDAYAKATPGVSAAGYDATTGRITIELTNGARFEFPPGRYRAYRTQRMPS